MLTTRLPGNSPGHFLDSISMRPACTETKFCFSSVNLSCVNFTISPATRPQDGCRARFPLPYQFLHTFPIKSTLTTDPFTLVALMEDLDWGGVGGRSQGHPMEDSPPHLAGSFQLLCTSTLLPLSPFPLSSQEQNQVLFLSLKAL